MDGFPSTLISGTYAKIHPGTPNLVAIMLYAFFWVIPRRLNFMCRRFGTLFHLHRQVGAHLPAYADGTECSETSAYKIQKPANQPKESIKHSGHGESLVEIVQNIGKFT